jgi:hypothetical protein
VGFSDEAIEDESSEIAMRVPQEVQNRVFSVKTFWHPGQFTSASDLL